MLIYVTRRQQLSFVCQSNISTIGKFYDRVSTARTSCSITKQPYGNCWNCDFLSSYQDNTDMRTRSSKLHYCNGNKKKLKSYYFNSITLCKQFNCFYILADCPNVNQRKTTDFGWPSRNNGE